MRCDQCKYWSQEEEVGWEAGGIGFHKCTAIRERWEIQDEASAGLTWNSGAESAYSTARKDALRAARAYVQDGSEYIAELVTGPNFFCALYDPRHG